MKEFRNIRDRFVVQDEHTIRTVTIICALFLLVSVFASLFIIFNKNNFICYLKFTERIKNKRSIKLLQF